MAAIPLDGRRPAHSAPGQPAGTPPAPGRPLCSATRRKAQVAALALSALALASGPPPAALAGPATVSPPASASTAPALAPLQAPAPNTQAAAAAPIRLRLIAFNDFHGHLSSGELSLNLVDPADARRTLRVPAGGAAALAGLVRSLRQDAAHSLLLSSGDLVGATPLVSALFFHESTVDVMNRIGLDLGVVGNHEFDAGPAELLRLARGGCQGSTEPAKGQTAGPSTTMTGSPVSVAPPGSRSCALGRFEGARFPLLAANVHPLSASADWLPGHVVREVAGVKVGVIGVVTRSTPWIVRPAGVAGLRFEDEAVALRRGVAELKAQGVRAIVALVHEGGRLQTEGGQPTDWNDSHCPGARGDLFDLLQRLPPEVDVVFSGHTHQGYRCMLAGRPVMQAVAHGRGLSVVDWQLDPQTGAVDHRATRSRNLPVFNEHTPPALREALSQAEPEPWRSLLRQARPDASVAERVAAYQGLAAPIAQRPVGRLGGHFDRRGPADSSAGRLVADAQLAATRAPEQGGAQFALTNAGGLRADLRCPAAPPCTVSHAQAFALQPFGNGLVVMSLSGRELKALLEDQQRGADRTPALLTPSANLRYRWLLRQPAGQRVRDLQLDGRAVQDGQRLRLVVNSYLAEGGDGQHRLRLGRERVGGPTDLEALLAFLASQPSPDPTPRITLVD